MRFVSLVYCLVVCSLSAEVVQSVSVRGSNVQVKLATQVGQEYDTAVIDKDLKTLWATGRFADIRVQREEQPDGVGVIFQVTETQTHPLHEMRIEPSTFGVQFKIPEGTPMDRERAYAAARKTREELRANGFQNAEVDFKLTPYMDQKVNLTLTVEPGQRIRVKQVEFTGDVALDPKQVQRAMAALKVKRLTPPIPGIWAGWLSYPAYSPDAVQSDLARIQSLYLSKGYLDINLRLDDIHVNHGDAKVTVRVDAGPQYRVESASLDGTSTNVGTPGDLCPLLFRERREAELQGKMDFNVSLDARTVQPAENQTPAIDLAATVERGPVYHIARIDFLGLEHYSDSMVRSNMQLAEGDLLDELLLRKSMARINQTGFFEPLSEHDMHVLTNENTGVANIAIQLRERKGGSWKLAGPVGTPSIGGPLEASIKSRLPKWGAGLFEMATYSVNLSLYAFLPPIVPALSFLPKGTILPVLSLQRPFIPGNSFTSGLTSGLFIAPQLGLKALGAIYVTTQIQQRLLPKLQGDRGMIPELGVNVITHKGEAMMFCEPPPPRMMVLRTGASFAIRFLGVLTGL
jgi:outer membrane protein assembly factor BamA